MSSQKAPAGHFTLLYFASSSSYTHKQHDFFPGPLLLSKLPDMLEKQYPGIKEKVMESCALTVNLDYVDLEEESGKGEEGLVVQPGDELAIIPPYLVPTTIFRIASMSRVFLARKISECTNGAHRFCLNFHDQSRQKRAVEAMRRELSCQAILQSLRCLFGHPAFVDFGSDLTPVDHLLCAASAV